MPVGLPQGIRLQEIPGIDRAHRSESERPKVLDGEIVCLGNRIRVTQFTVRVALTVVLRKNSVQGHAATFSSQYS